MREPVQALFVKLHKQAVFEAMAPFFIRAQAQFFRSVHFTPKILKSTPLRGEPEKTK
jgi:hypothetical protein